MLAQAVHGLLVTAARHDIPVVLVDFPGFVTDADKAWQSLGPVVSDRVTIDRFRQCHAQVMRPGDVHQQKRFGTLALVKLDLRWYRLRIARRVRQMRGQVRRATSPNASLARKV